MSQSKKNKIDWGLVLNEIDLALVYFQNEGVKPTLRTLFYYLFSKRLIPNTRSSYKGLSRILVKARKEGRYPWDFLEDRTRLSYGEFEDEKHEITDLEPFNIDMSDRLDNFDLDDLISEYFDYQIPEFNVGRWAEQPNAVEVWIEKEALASVVSNWCWNLYIPIKINKGYSSWTFIYNNVQNLKETLTKHDKVHIFYLGDLDYSGVDIQRFLVESLEYFGLDKDLVLLERIAIDNEQVEKYDLPPRPEDSETLERLNRDSRKNNYDLKYIVELDALLAYVPSEFKKIVIEAINSKWDKEIYKDLINEADRLRSECEEFIEDIKDQALDKLRSFLE